MYHLGIGSVTLMVLKKMLKEVTLYLCRPNNMILGRMFDHHMLDMIELGKHTT
jgi:hypothetical protein